MPIVHRRVILKPRNLSAAQHAQLADELIAAIDLQRQAATSSAHVLQLQGELQENEQAFFIAHEPAEPVYGLELYDPEAPLADEQEILSVTAAVLDALAAVHGLKGGRPGVHGGLCPSVFVRTSDGVEKLTDFGFTRAICNSLGVDDYLNLAVSPRTEGDEAILGTGVWQVLAADEDQRDDRICSFVDPEKYLTGALNTFEAGSDVIAAGFLLHLLAEHKHPYLWTDTGEVRRLVELCQFTLPTVIYNGARRADFRDSNNPAIRTWCELMVALLANLPHERPSASGALEKIRLYVRPIDQGELLRRSLRALIKSVREKPPAEAKGWRSVQGLAGVIAANAEAPLDVADEARAFQREAEARTHLLAAEGLLSGDDWASAEGEISRVTQTSALPADMMRVAEELARTFDRNRNVARSLQNMKGRLGSITLEDPPRAVDLLEQLIAEMEALGEDDQLVPAVRDERQSLRDILEVQLARAKVEEEEDQANHQRAMDWLADLGTALEKPDLDAFGRLLENEPAIGRWHDQIRDPLSALTDRFGQYQTACSWIDRARELVESADWDGARRLLSDEKPQLEHWPGDVVERADKLSRKVELEFKRLTDDRAARAYVSELTALVDEEKWLAATDRLARRPGDIEHWPKDVLKQEEAFRKQIESGVKVVEADFKKARLWIAPAQKAGAKEQWDKVRKVLDQPPKLAHWPEDVTLEADRLSASAWFASLEKALDEGQVDAFDRLVIERPEIVHEPEGFDAGIATLRKRRADYEAATSWLSKIRGAVEVEDWDQAEAYFESKPEVEYWPERVRDEAKSLAQQVQSARRIEADHAAAHEWFDRLRAAVDADQPDWAVAGEILSQEPELEHWPDAVQKSKADYRERVVEAVEAERLLRLRMAEDQKKAKQWWSEVETAAGGQDWNAAAALLNAPPELEYWPGGLEAEADALRVEVWRQRCLGALEADDLDTFDRLFESAAQFTHREEAVEGPRNQLSQCRADFVAARDWTDHLEHAIQTEDWKEANALASKRPEVDYWPKHLEEKASDLVQFLERLIDEHAKARAWISGLKQIVESEEPDWFRAGEILTGKPELTHWPQDVLRGEPALTARVEEGIKDEELRRLKMAEDRRKAEAWLDKARAAGEAGEWAEALAALKAPPELEYWPENAREDADRLHATMWYRRCGDALDRGDIDVFDSLFNEPPVLEHEPGAAVTYREELETRRKDFAAASSWLNELREHLDAERWERATTLFTQKPALQYWPASMRQEADDLGERLQEALAQLAQATDWFNKVKAAVDVDEPDWRAVSAAWEGRPDVQCWPEEILQQRTAYEQRISDGISAFRWLQEAQAVVQGGNWPQALFILERPPECKRLHPAILRSVSALREQCTTRLKKAVRQAAGAFVTEVVKQQYGKVLDPGLVQVDTDDVNFSCKEPVIEGRATLYANLIERVAGPEESSTSSAFTFDVKEGQLVIEDKDGKVGRRLTTHFTKLLTDLQKTRLSQLVKPISKGMFPQARVEVRLDGLPERGRGVWKVLGPENAAGFIEEELSWDRSKLRWVHGDLAAFTQRLADIAADEARRIVFERIVSGVDSLAAYRSICSLDVEPQSIDSVGEVPRTITLACTLRLRPVDRGAELALPSFSVQCKRVGKLTSSPDMASIDNHLREAVLQRQHATRDEITQTLRTCIKEAGGKVRCRPVPRHLRHFLPEMHFELKPRGVEGRRLAARWQAERLAFELSPDWEKELEAATREAAGAGAPTRSPWAVIGACVAVIAVTYGTWTLLDSGNGPPRELTPTRADVDRLAGEIRTILANEMPSAPNVSDALAVQPHPGPPTSLDCALPAFAARIIPVQYDSENELWQISEEGRTATDTFARQLRDAFVTEPGRLTALVVDRCVREAPIAGLLDPTSVRVAPPRSPPTWTLKEGDRWTSTTELMVDIGGAGTTTPLPVELQVADGEVRLVNGEAGAKEELTRQIQQKLVEIQNASLLVLLSEGRGTIEPKGGTLTPAPERIAEPQETVVFGIEIPDEGMSYSVEAHWNSETLAYQRSGPWYTPASVPPVTPGDVEHVVGEIVAVLTEGVPSVEAFGEAIEILEEPDATGEPSISFMVPGFGLHKVLLDYDHAGGEWGLAAEDPEAVEALARRIDNELSNGPTRLLEGLLYQVRQDGSLSSIIPTNSIEGAMSPASWQRSADRSGWEASTSITLEVNGEAIGDALDVTVVTQEEQVRFVSEVEVGDEVAVRLWAFLVAKQNARMEASLQRLQDRLAPLGAIVRASEERLTEPARVVSYTISSEVQKQAQTIEAQWNPQSLAYEPASEWADTLSGTIAGLSVLQLLNEDRGAVPWLDALPADLRFHVLDDSTDSTLSLAVTAPWASDLEALPSELPVEERLPLQVDLAPVQSAVSDQLELDKAVVTGAVQKPAYWPLMVRFMDLRGTKQDFSIVDAFSLRRRWIALPPNVKGSCPELEDYLYGPDAPQMIVPHVEVLAQPAAFHSGPDPELSLRYKGDWDLAPGAKDVELNRDQTTGLLELWRRSFEGTFTLVPAPAGGARFKTTGSELDEFLRNLCRTFGEARRVNESLTGSEARATLEAELRGALSVGADRKALTADEAFGFLSGIWEAKRATIADGDLNALTQSIRDNLPPRVRGKNDTVAPTVFCEYFVGPEEAFAIVWSAVPEGAVDEGPVLLRLGPISELSEENPALGETVLARVFDEVTGAIRAVRTFDKQLGIVLALDEPLTGMGILNLSFPARKSRVRPAGEAEQRMELEWDRLADLESGGYLSAVWLVPSLAEPTPQP
ncbi:MAG: hypothetical protein JSV78_07930 [Phycisphaerales bacterium]|nr:MAG: hypothetical protein JSV78_07930 [Phycisphaerales bacterium]